MLLRVLPWSSDSIQKLQSQWNRENCIVLRHAADARFGPWPQTLTIRAAWNGMEHCHLAHRSIGVDDDNFLVLNEGCSYSTSIRATRPVESLAICFQPELVRQTHAAMTTTLARALDDGPTLSGGLAELPETLQPHDKLVSPVLRFIKAHVMQGVREDAWYEEQLLFLLERLQSHRRCVQDRIDAIDLQRAGKRREVFRRIGRAADYLHTNYAGPITLDELAQAACLSKYHFLRLFQQVHGMTPIAYLQRKRAAAAVRLLRTTQLNMSEIACAVGFVHRKTVTRHMRRWTAHAGAPS